MNTKTIKAPLMYKGWIIYKSQDNKMYYAHNLATDKYINPLFRTWPLLKKIIDNLKTL